MRLYNGCPDDELAAIWKGRDDARAEATRLGYIITYFPVEGKYAASRRENYVSVGPFCASPQECLIHIKSHVKGST